MSIDLGLYPIPPAANPTADEATQIKTVLGLNTPTLKYYDSTDPSNFTLDIYSTVVVSGATAFGAPIPPKTFYYAGIYDGYPSYTEDGVPWDGGSDVIYYYGPWMETRIILNGYLFRGINIATYPNDINNLYYYIVPPGCTPPTNIIFPIYPTVMPDGIGQILVWKASGAMHQGTPLGPQTDSYFISVFSDQGPIWVRIPAVGGNYGTPSYINLANGTGLSAQGITSGVLQVSKGGTGATSTAGAGGFNTTRLLIEDNSSTSITLSDAFSGKILRTTSNSAVTITIPSNLGVNFNLRVIQQGTGVVTFAGTGITIQSKLTYKKISNQFGAVELLRVANATYNLAGDLMA